MIALPAGSRRPQRSVLGRCLPLAPAVAGVALLAGILTGVDPSSDAPTPPGESAAADTTADRLVPSLPPGRPAPSEDGRIEDAPREPSGVLTADGVATVGSASAESGPGGRGAPVPGPVPAVVPGPAAPRASRCVGDPPRQAFSVFSAPCRLTPSGPPEDGVDEVRVSVLAEHTSCDGPVPAVARPGETSGDRTYRVLQEWVNRNYDLGGRRLQLMGQRTDRYDDVSQAAAVRAAEEEFGSFAIVEPGFGAIDFGPAAGLVTFADYSLPARFYEERAPYLYNVGMDYTTSSDLAAEVVCTKLAGRPPAFTDDPVLGLVPERAFGVIYYDDFFVDARVLSTATTQGYFPEWIVTAQGGHEDNTMAATFPQEQWRHAFGISPDSAHTWCVEAAGPVTELLGYNTGFVDALASGLLAAGPHPWEITGLPEPVAAGYLPEAREAVWTSMLRFEGPADARQILVETGIGFVAVVQAVAWAIGAGAGGHHPQQAVSAWVALSTWTGAYGLAMFTDPATDEVHPQ